MTANLILFLVKASHWLNPVVHLIGLAICIVTYRVCRKRSYLVLGAYFLIAAGTLLFGPKIRRAFSEQPSALSAEAEQRFQEELSALNEKYHPASGKMPAMRAHKIDLKFPLGSILLVSGLWMLSREEKR